MSRRKIAGFVIAALIVAAAGYRIVSSGGAARHGPMGGGTGGSDQPVPVTVVPVERRNVPVYLYALGTVQALNTVTIKPLVGGQIESIEFREGHEIRQGGIIARIDPRPLQAALDQALAKQKQDEAQLAASRSTLKRYEELFQKHFVAAQDLENQRQTVKQQEALIVADAAAIANARVQLGYTTIRAPITGLAGIRQIDVGNIAQANSSTVVVLTQVHPINVVFTLPEQNLDQVRVADDEPLHVSARGRGDASEVAAGALAVVDNQIDPNTGTFKLKAEFANENNVLWPGQFVNVRLEVRTLQGGLVVPATAVQRGPDGSYVYLLQDDGTVAQQPVQTGIEAGDGLLLVSSGLNEGQKVVTEGQFRLKPGAKVLALKPGETPPVAAPADQDAQKRQGPRRRGG